MIIREDVPLSELTTLRVGGLAHIVTHCASVDEVRAALLLAKERGVPCTLLGGGSNVLAPDAGFPGMVMRIIIEGIELVREGTSVLVTAGAGVAWDDLVTFVAAHGLWGIENLAGIPGMVGAAPLPEHFGAYGSEVQETLVSVQAFNTKTWELEIVEKSACAFGYRESRFKRERNLLITRVTFKLSFEGKPNLSYKDLHEHPQAPVLTTPRAVSEVVRTIRARKFPDLREVGTAGSFFKNPVISFDTYQTLQTRYSALPSYAAADGVKIPLAFVLDQILGLRGYKAGSVRLFEAQPLVLVAEAGATADAIDSFASDVASRVHDATGILIEREVQSMIKNNYEE